jgi:hypothetical protein
MSSPDPNPLRPPLRSHFAPFAEGPRAWLVLVRNAIPVIGFYWLGWSADVIAFQLWFSGVTALAAMLALHLRAFARTEGGRLKPPPNMPAQVMPGVLAAVWLILWLLLGLPYWFTLLFLGVAVFDNGFWNLAAGDPGVVATLLLVAVSNLVEESRRGYERMSTAEVRLEFNWDFSMHLARVAAMLLVTFVLRLGLIVGLALALSYVEIYPMRTLRFLGGDRTLEAGNEDRSRD